MRQLAVALVALLLLAAPLAAQHEHEGEEPGIKNLTIGIYLAPGDNYLTYEVEDNPGTYGGFEIELLKAIVLQELDDVDIQMVRVPTLPDRISYLQNGTVDVVLGSFIVTPQREELVDFVFPAYYSGAAALFAPRGVIPNVTTWEELKGLPVAIPNGHFEKEQLLSYGLEPVWVDSADEAAATIEAGEAVAFVDITYDTHEKRNLSLVETPAPLDSRPVAIAVAKNSTVLKEEIAEALRHLVSGGQSAPILGIEEKSLGALGVPPNPDLAKLVEDPSSPSLLNPEPEG